MLVSNVEEIIYVKGSVLNLWSPEFYDYTAVSNILGLNRCGLTIQQFNTFEEE